MHPANRLLNRLGIGLHRLPRVAAQFRRSYDLSLQQIRAAPHGFRVLEALHCDIGSHPVSYKEFECGFAASCLARERPGNVLDIGSYREFVLGLSAGYRVTSLDIRERPGASDNETVVVADAKRIPFADGEFAAVVSLSSIEHFGLGRYGDAVNLEGDAEAMREMKRCVSPGGILVITTTVTAGAPVLVFNAHRIYSLDMIRSLCAPFAPLREAFYSHRLGRFCDYAELLGEPGIWDVYCGCWRKA